MVGPKSRFTDEETEARGAVLSRDLVVGIPSLPLVAPVPLEDFLCFFFLKRIFGRGGWGGLNSFPEK